MPTGRPNTAIAKSTGAGWDRKRQKRLAIALPYGAIVAIHRPAVNTEKWGNFASGIAAREKEGRARDEEA